ncbi:site-specific DNA-methyltransferase [Pseudaquidulcibacter saccharophilus]|uniref:site-specific DNA-methyltransferase n=1 Tax=Pseudaquidulcibacter saccharophilus TaxID=2831900 RepID=UPI001EFF518A|nr:DNA methyltransferase [Pseudaquidulcibacter saccharophilus]
MSRLTDLIAQAKAKDPKLGQELEREFKTLSSRRSFGLNFERHKPENVELPGRPVRKGDKVRILPPRGTTGKGDQRLWKVTKIENLDGQKFGQIELLEGPEKESQRVNTLDLVVVAEFMDYIYPGLVSTGKVERGGEKPYHTVINGENFHALEALTFTHRGKIDVIYIDPPYNTGAKDWKYNNDYVESEDIYRHSKWLAFMERRLQISRQLINHTNGVLLVTIDEKEYLRLGMLLEQIFTDARIQMISTVIKPGGVSRDGFFARSVEYIFIVMFGTASPVGLQLSEEWGAKKQKTSGDVLYWNTLWRSGSSPQREGHADTFYPIFVDLRDGTISSIGDPIGEGTDRKSINPPNGTISVWPIRNDGSEGRWQLASPTARIALSKGYIRIGKLTGEKTRIYYLARGEQRRIEEGTISIVGRRHDGSVIGGFENKSRDFIPTDSWSIASHDATRHGSIMLNSLLPKRAFPFPKSLYAVEDVLRFFVAQHYTSTILDFFAGSGTTAHAVMRLNKQDGGKRKSILITNNEVASTEQRNLRELGLRPGDPEWEKWGICDYITKPRIEAAIKGRTPEGDEIKGDYKFTDEFPMSDGFEENAEFFTLAYETPVSVSHNRAFERIAPLLWMRAGSEGRRIQKIPPNGWDLADTYGLLIDLDKSSQFCEAIESKNTIRIAYVVTDDERRFQSIVRQLPKNVEPVRLYESYLTNFRFSMGR